MHPGKFKLIYYVQSATCSRNEVGCLHTQIHGICEIYTSLQEGRGTYGEGWRKERFLCCVCCPCLSSLSVVRSAFRCSSSSSVGTRFQYCFKLRFEHTASSKQTDHTARVFVLALQLSVLDSAVGHRAFSWAVRPHSRAATTMSSEFTKMDRWSTVWVPL